MAKRFIGTDIWGQDWFLDMPNEYKLFWNYVLCECDHAGFFKVNTRSFTALIGVNINKDIALELFNSDKERIRVVKDSLWFIEDFISFQYGNNLNPKNRVHESIINLTNKLGVLLTSIRGLNDFKEGVKDKDKDKDKDSSTVEKEDDKIFKKIKHLLITVDENKKLISLGYDQIQVNSIYDAIENYAKNKSYTSLYLTAIKWLKKEYPNVTAKQYQSKLDIPAVQQFYSPSRRQPVQGK